VGRTARVVLEVELDEAHLPIRIRWQATDGPEEPQPCTAVLLSIWDGGQQQSLGLDLWTKEMPVADMHLFYYQTLLRLADTLERAVHDAQLAAALRSFAQDFGRMVAERLARPQ